MPDYSGESYSQAMGRLTGFGTAINQFNQGTFRDRAVHTTTEGRFTQAGVGGRSLGDGYCAGVCLDWVRRVLLSTADRDASFLNYGYTQLKAGEGHHGHTADDTSERSYQSVGRMGQAWYMRNDVHWTGFEGDEDYTVNAEEFRTMVRSMDNFFDRSRREVGRETTDKHFSDLVVLASNRRVHPDARSWMMSWPGACRPGACIQMNFSPSGGSGHAVVAWQRLANHEAAGAFYFFDPNFGVFSYNRRSLALALRYLFSRERDHTPYYASCSSINAQVFSYVVYGPPNLVQAVPQPQPTVVQTPPPQPIVQQVRTTPTTPRTVGQQRPRGFAQSAGTPTPTPTPPPTPLRPRYNQVTGASSDVRAMINRFNQNG
jgi:hypothetical protein